MEGTLIFVLSLFVLHKSFAVEIKTISNSRFLTDGDTLVSTTRVFELGFFPPNSSENRYLGIWYKNIPVRTVVWVANRDRPVPGASTSMLELKIIDQGILGLFANISMIWSSNTTSTGNATAKLHDNGNLVVTDQDEKVVWQSFDYPTDTLLPGMKLGRDYLRGKEWYLTPWKSSQDPAPSGLTWGADRLGYPENKLRQGDSIIFRGGPWANQRFPGVSVFSRSLTFRYDVIINESEVSFAYNLEDNSILSRVTLNSTAQLESWAWVEGGTEWRPVVSFPRGACDKYNICNAYGTCSINMIQQSCTCLDARRFVPKNQKAWDTADWSGGCIRRTALKCKNGTEGFIKYSNVKLPDAENTWFNMSMTLEECRSKCLTNCSCMAYANPDKSRSVCLLWFSDLFDIQILPEDSGGPDIFVRMASSELDSQSENQGGGNSKIILLVIILPGVLFIGLIIGTWLCYARRKKNHAKLTGGAEAGEIMNASKSQEEDMELPTFSFSAIVNATANFSPDNKLGEGGFGPVYKGMLEEKEIAVKRLSRHSSQGLNEFKNEVICISKLQHRNLVKLLGCCIQGDEKLLIYEYMPNKSLDSFIFDDTKSVVLDWETRFNIIKGIARGLLYLHQDSRLRIIHRDLKASNILLDLDMNPKISDFGLARSFGGNETQANTQRVVGTYGYMAPEYALDGVFSIKSDVFSFGVLVLEIVSGKRNRGFIKPENGDNLMGHVWMLYNEDRSIELIDPNCTKSCDPLEVIRSIKVGLLCVQQNAADRPNMSNVIMMLGSESELPEPKQPSFLTEKDLPVVNYSTGTYTGGSMKNFTITEVGAR
ncbi:hypothetical protein QVD17_05378 [Tagetes erecta]|uniref:Receptor-like serine/threonine-protein kinase n=1 Tax=Tagetes erecta TaxID=13708 RepID=A0AAD8LE97_TARER|nr:hypothetical protein QVD17_05378 [Tagetes erecta]